LHTQGLDTSTPTGKAMFQLLGVFAELERSIKSYDFTERPGDFSDEPKRRADNLYGDGQHPETAQAVANALVMTCEALGLSNRDEAMTQLVARKIIELAQRGLKSPTELHLAAIKELKPDPQ